MGRAFFKCAVILAMSVQVAESVLNMENTSLCDFDIYMVNSSNMVSYKRGKSITEQCSDKKEKKICVYSETSNINISIF